MPTFLRTGDISHRIGLVVTTELLTKLGFPPDKSDGRSKLWDEAKYPAICRALGEYVAARDMTTGAAPSKAKTPDLTTADDDEL